MVTTQLGNKIREHRKKTGISQENFANEIEMNRSYLATVEAGKRNISVLNIEKIANGFGITMSELFQGVGCNAAQN